MSRRFSVGELVVMCNANYHVEYDGAPALVVGALAPRRGLDLSTMEFVTVNCYDVEVLVEPSRKVLAYPHQLRPLRGDPERARALVRTEPAA